MNPGECLTDNNSSVEYCADACEVFVFNSSCIYPINGTVKNLQNAIDSVSVDVVNINSNISAMIGMANHSARLAECTVYKDRLTSDLTVCQVLRDKYSRESEECNATLQACPTHSEVILLNQQLTDLKGNQYAYWGISFALGALAWREWTEKKGRGEDRSAHTHPPIKRLR